MNTKDKTKNVPSSYQADDNDILKGVKKRDLLEVEKYIEMASTEHANKRLKLNEENIEAFDVEMAENEKAFQHKNKKTDSVKTRTDSRRKLTAENIKTILRFVLANNSVLSMVQSTMKLQKENESRQEKEDQPETTTSKVCVEAPLHFLTPKKTTDVSKNLLEEEYSEESASDEDYHPNEEELSDEDAASSVKTYDLNSSKMDESDILPDVKSPNQLSDDEDALVIALPETNVSHDKEVDKIAQRTRSKFCLNDTPLETIELSFQPPDITFDMYDTHCDDANWEEFLCEFTKPLNQTLGVGSIADDTEDEKDPEYKVQEGEEEEDEDEEEIDYNEICGENPLEVTSDEVNALMTEILEFVQQDKNLLEEDFSFLEELNETFSTMDKNLNNPEKEETNVAESENNKTDSKIEGNSNELETNLDATASNEKENISNSEELRETENHSENLPHSVEEAPSSPIENERKEWMIPDERRQLDEQMRMYVQMLTQSYLLSYGFPSLNFLNASSVTFLNEIKMFASRETINKQRSAFYTHNLDDALDIVKKFESQTLSEKDLKRKMNRGIADNIKKALASSKAFIYPELLPKCGFYTFFTGSKASFSVAEDNLIALGLAQFSCMDNPHQSIQQYLLPTKSEYQIKCRIKNSKQKKEEENAIAYFYKYKKLPDINRVIRIFDPSNIKAPEDYPPSFLPAWMEPFSKMSLEYRNWEKQRKQNLLQQGLKPKLILPRIQIVPTIFQEYHPPDPQGVPQPVICKVYSVNEKNTLPGSSGIVLPRRIRRRRKKLQKNQVNKSTQYPEIPSESACTSQTIKQEVYSEGTSDEESDESEYNSDSATESSLNSHSPVPTRNYSTRKRTMVTRSMSTNHETSQTEPSELESLSSFSETSNLVSVKEEPLLNESCDVEDFEDGVASNTNHPETSNLRTLNNLTHNKPNQSQVEPSTLTEPSLRIVTSQGDESSDSDESNVICNELLAPIQKFYCGISEDAVLPPESSSVQKHLPSDFSAIRDIITSEEKRDNFVNTAKAKVRSKKSNKSKKSWSTEEDQLIISNCQKYGINKRAFRTSADEIGSVTPVKVRQRFIHLLKLLSEKLKTGK